MHTVPTKDRFGLVMVKGQPYQIVDIGMRMLAPRELYRAQGFNDSYIIEWGTDPFTGDRVKLTKTAQVRMVGNSVCPPVAAALVKANYTEQVREPELEAA
jgi:DNA (cytosine-5)-methyltransferase 1